MHAVFEANFVQQCRGARLAVLSVLVVPQRQHHVLEGVQAGQEVEGEGEGPQEYRAQDEDFEVRIGGVIKAVRPVVAKAGKAMAFVQLEDLTATIEVL